MTSKRFGTETDRRIMLDDLDFYESEFQQKPTPKCIDGLPHKWFKRSTGDFECLICDLVSKELTPYEPEE